MIQPDMIVKVIGDSKPELQGLTGKVLQILEYLPSPYVVAFGAINEEETTGEFLESELIPVSFVDQEEATGEWIGMAGPCLLCDMPKGIKHLHIKR